MANITRAMAGLLLRDLPQYLASAEKGGIAAPKLSLQYADGLSRSDAVALQQWGQKIPAVRAALANAGHPDNGAVRAYAALTQKFAVHPETASGEPAPWDEPISPALAGFLLGTRNKIEAGELSPAEARTLADYSFTRADLTGAAGDKADPRHGEVAAELASLLERAAAANGEAPAQAPAPAAMEQAGAARAEINRLLADSDFMAVYCNRRSPGHDGAVARMVALHEALAPGNAAGNATAPPVPANTAAGADLAALQGKIATLNRQLRDFTISAPGRAALADELVFLTSQLPAGVMPAQPADRQAVPAGGREVETVAGAGRGLTERSIELTNRLRAGGLRGAARAAVLEELQQALDAGQAEADATTAAGDAAA